MTHLKQDEVMELKAEGLSNRAIAKKLRLSPSMVDRIFREVGGDGMGAGGDGSRGIDDGAAIVSTARQRTANLNPWILLIYEAAVQQIPELRGISLDSFIYYCCDFVKDFFRLTPPGWAMKPSLEVDLTEPEEWQLPQVIARVEKMEQEVQDAEGEPTENGGTEPERQPAGAQPGDESGDDPGSGSAGSLVTGEGEDKG